MGSILSKNAIDPLVPLEASMASHVEAALDLEHPFRAAPPIPVDLQYAMKVSEDVATAGFWRAEQWAKVELLSLHCEELNSASGRGWIRQSEVSPARCASASSPSSCESSSERTGKCQLCSLEYLTSWTRSPANIYPDKFPPFEEPFEDLLSAASCDQWNSKLSRDLNTREYDAEIFDGAVQQQKIGLLSRFFQARDGRSLRPRPLERSEASRILAEPEQGWEPQDSRYRQREILET